jgi:phosphohistidine phosphatase
VRVYLVRHAEAAPGSPDELRPLTDAGRRAARELGSRLAADGPLDAVVCSPLVRAVETAVAISRSAQAPEPRIEPALAPGATATALLAAVTGLGSRVVAVAHQPDCSRIAAALTGEELPFPPGGVATIEISVP